MVKESNILLEMDNLNSMSIIEASADYAIEKVQNEKGSHFVKHHVFDMRHPFLQNFLRKIFMHHDEEFFPKTNGDVDSSSIEIFSVFQKDGFSTHLDLALYLSRIMSIYGSDIKQMTHLRMLIKSRFNISSKFVMFLAVVHFIGFIVPFCIQTFSSNEKWVIMLNCFCLFTQVFFILIEAVQLRAHGMKEYFGDAWNLIDSIFFLQYLMYFICRM
jgi:hypothetical protein